MSGYIWIDYVLRIRFRVVVAWSNSLSQICNGKFGLTLQNPAIKWFLNFSITRSAAFRRCIFGGTNLQSIFLSWGLWRRMLESSLSVFWKRGFEPLIHRLFYNISYALTSDYPSQFLLLMLGWHCCCSHTSPVCIYSLLKIWMVICLSGLNISSLLIQWHHTLFHLLYN